MWGSSRSGPLRIEARSAKAVLYIESFADEAKTVIEIADNMPRRYEEVEAWLREFYRVSYEIGYRSCLKDCDLVEIEEDNEAR